MATPIAVTLPAPVLTADVVPLLVNVVIVPVLFRPIVPVNVPSIVMVGWVPALLMIGQVSPSATVAG